MVSAPPGGGLGFLLLGNLETRYAVELARYADAQGLGSVWLTDEPFFRGAMPTAAACAVATSQIRIGLGVVNPFDRPPVWMAMDAAAVSELAQGRAVLGIGASWEPPITKQGIPFTRPLSAVRDSVAIVRALLAGERCSYTGRKFEISDVKLDFVLTGTPPPIYVASMFRRSLVQTGEIADGVILSLMCPAPYVRNAVRLLREGRARTPRSVDGFGVVQYLVLCVDEDGARARRAVKEMLAFFIVHSFGPEPEHWRQVAELGEFDLAVFGDLHASLAKSGAAHEVISDEFARQFGVAGTPRECLDLLAEYKAAGVTEAVALFPQGIDPREQIRLLAECVAPEWSRI
jgi:5,10-methylenetetrahydromethanopterin reductase